MSDQSETQGQDTGESTSEVPRPETETDVQTPGGTTVSETTETGGTETQEAGGETEGGDSGGDTPETD